MSKTPSPVSAASDKKSSTRNAIIFTVVAAVLLGVIITLIVLYVKSSKKKCPDGAGASQPPLAGAGLGFGGDGGNGGTAVLAGPVSPSAFAAGKPVVAVTGSPSAVPAVLAGAGNDVAAGPPTYALPPPTPSQLARAAQLTSTHGYSPAIALMIVQDEDAKQAASASANGTGYGAAPPVAAAVVTAAGMNTASGAGRPAVHLGDNFLRPASDRSNGGGGSNNDHMMRTAQGLVSPPVTGTLDGTMAAAGVGASPAAVAMPSAVGAVGPTHGSLLPHDSTPPTGVLPGAGEPFVEPVVTAEQVLALVQHPTDGVATVMVAMHGCGGCIALRKTLREAVESGKVAGAVFVILERDQWQKISDKFPATRVPALFKVGHGKITPGPVGAMPVANLVQYIRSAGAA